MQQGHKWAYVQYTCTREYHGACISSCFRDNVIIFVRTRVRTMVECVRTRECVHVYEYHGMEIRAADIAVELEP